MAVIPSPEHDLAIPNEAEPIIQQETREHPPVEEDE